MVDRSYCGHCLGEVKGPGAVIAEGRAFCCEGCRSIYRLLGDHGFEDFYQRRTDWLPGPPDTAEVSASYFEETVSETSDGYQVELRISGIRCTSCVWLLERFFSKTAGIIAFHVNYSTHRALARWDPEKITLNEILQKIRSIGYSPCPALEPSFGNRLRDDKRRLLIRVTAASFFSLQLMLFTAALYSGYFQGIDTLSKRLLHILAWGMATPVMFYAGYPFFISAFRAIRNGMANMDTLVFVGSFSAYAYSVFQIYHGGEVFFDTSAMVITLILAGRLLEAGSRQRASEEALSLMTRQPREARKREVPGAEPASVPVSSISEGDFIEVLPGDTVPLDGEVLEGESEVDESMLTGESMPVSKTRGADVFAGTANVNGWLLLRVKRLPGSSALASVARAVEQAQAGKAPIQRISDRAVGWFVPSIMVMAVGTLLFWGAWGSDSSEAVMNAVSVLVVACPCALGLATPLAIMLGAYTALKRGILINGGDITEAASKVDMVVFDKTGTLTMGKPTLTGVYAQGVDAGELHRLAASVEQGSEHAVARALKDGVDLEDLIPVKAFRAFPGGGVEGIVGGSRILTGSPAFLTSNGTEIEPQDAEKLDLLSSGGKTVMGLSRDGIFSGWLVISDKIRPRAHDTIETLRSMGIGIRLFTGDSRHAAHHAAREMGILPEEVFSEATPLQKASAVGELKSAGHTVMMVGDGINDAPALAEADVGVAIGGATDVAMKSAGAVLMRKEPTLVPFFIGLARRTLRTIKWNLFWAFSYNIIAIPLAASGRLHPIISAGLMALSSFVVIGNSFRLWRGRTPGRDYY